MTAKMKLELLAEIFDDYETDQPGQDGDCKVREGENIVDRECEGLSLSIRASEFSHQEIGIEEEDDEAYFDRRSPNRRLFSRLIRIRAHRVTIARKYCGSAQARPQRIQIVSFGKEHPSCTADHEACRQDNRREHIVGN